ncbi:hypothetical protein NL676_012579 [Syzygium grande]|nr:hypothetical protein NL676_012579 [Syzygium grande]
MWAGQGEKRAKQQRHLAGPIAAKRRLPLAGARHCTMVAVLRLSWAAKGDDGGGVGVRVIMGGGDGRVVVMTRGKRGRKCLGGVFGARSNRLRV